MFLLNPLSFLRIKKRKLAIEDKPAFLPSSGYFLSARSVTVEPVIKSGIEVAETSLPPPPSPDFRRITFIPSSGAFLSATSVATEPVVQSGIEASGTLLSLATLTDSRDIETVEPDSSKPTVYDKSKRNFLKVAGVASVSLVASLFLPKKAEAFIMGSSPATGVVGVKDSTNVRINPATEETLDEVLKTSDLTFDAGSLQVKVTSVSGDGSSSFSDSGNVAKSGLVDADRHVQVDVLELPSSASTETTLQTIAFGGVKFALRLATDGSIDYVGEAAIGTATSAASWRVKRVDSTTGIVIEWAGTGVFDQVWDNYSSLTYS